MNPEAAEERPAPGLLARSWFRQLLDMLFGYDFFISYCWDDGGAYAVKLARDLEADGFDVFLDRDDYVMGEDWKEVGAWTLRRTGQLILVASPSAMISEPVAREVRIFSTTRRRIIPIDIDGAMGASSSSLVSRYISADALKIRETGSLQAGPTLETLAAVRQSFTLIRQDKKRIGALGAVAVSLAVLSVAAAISGLRAQASSRIAQANAEEAVRQRDAAGKANSDAQAARREAERDRSTAEASAREAEHQAQEADRQAGIARERAAEAMRAQKSAELALARSQASGLAARAQAAANERPELAATLAIEGLARAESYGFPSREAEESLRKALATSRGQRVFCLPGRIEADYTDTRIRALAWSRNRKRLAASTGEGSLCLFDQTTDQGYRLAEALQGFGHGPDLVAFSADDRWLVTRTPSGSLRALDLGVAMAPDRPRFSVNNDAFEGFGSADTVGPTAVSADGSTLAFIRHDLHAVEVWTLGGAGPNGQPERVILTDGQALALDISAGGDTVAVLIDDTAALKAQGALPTREARRESAKQGLRLEVWGRMGAAPRLRRAVLLDIERDLESPSLWENATRVRLGPEGRWAFVARRIDNYNVASVEYAAELWRLDDGAATPALRFNGNDDTNDAWQQLTDFGFFGRDWLYAMRGAEIRAWDLTESEPSDPADRVVVTPPAERGRDRGSFQAIASAPEHGLVAASDSNGAMNLWRLNRTADASSPEFSLQPQGPEVGRGGIVALSGDGAMLAMGGVNGGIQICRVADRCAPASPGRKFPSGDQGQLAVWTHDPRRRWHAAVFETGRLQIWRGDEPSPVFGAELIAKGQQIGGLVQFRGARRDPLWEVALESAPNGNWAVAYEEKRHGFQNELTLVRLDNPASTKLTPADYGCARFSRITFVPDSRAVALWDYDQPCAAIVDLPEREAQLAPAKVRPVTGYQGGVLSFSQGGAYALARRYDKQTTIFARDASGGYGAIASGLNQAVIAGHAPWAVVQSPTSELRVLSLLPGLSVRTLPRIEPDAVLAISPDDRWLVVVGGRIGASRHVELWDTSDWTGPAGSWPLEMEKVDPAVVFSDDGVTAVVGPSHIIRPEEGRPAPRLPALTLRLSGAKPTMRRFEIPLSYYEITGWTGSTGVSSDPLTYRFSSDARWLTTGHPGHIFALDRGGVRHVRYFDDIPVISPDSRWLASREPEGIRSWRLADGALEDRGLVAPPGAMAFTADSKGLEVLVDGEVQTHPLDPRDLRIAARIAFGGNPDFADWRREMKDAPYRAIYADLPPHFSVIKERLRVAAEQVERGNAKAASESLLEASRVAVANRSVWPCLGVVRAAILLKLPAAAEVAMNYAVETMPQDFTVRELRGRLRLASGDRQGAIEDFGYASRFGDEGWKATMLDRIAHLKVGMSVPLTEPE